MSAVSAQRFLVTGYDHDVWRIVVEAADHDEAIRKAEAIYFTDGFGRGEAFSLQSSYIDWKAEPLMQQAQP